MIHELESLVRAGQLDLARQRLCQLNLRKLPRREAVAYANLARRAGLSRLSLRILNPIVRASGQKSARAAPPATSEEEIEYAAALRVLGAVPEATEILSKDALREHPQAVLQLAFCLITEWHYRRAIPLLRNYIASCGRSRGETYALSIGKVNLLEAYIHEGSASEARELVDELLHEVDRGKQSLLYLKCLDLAAQSEIFLDENYDRAISRLKEAGRLLEQSPSSVHSLMIAKWFAVARSLKSRRVMPDLFRLRADAIKLENWETVRDCDFYAARLKNDHDALTHLYFGTPFDSFRVKIQRSLDPRAELPDKYIWSGDRRAGKERVFDLVMAEDRSRDISLPPGQALHRLLILLCHDFYRPVPLLSIFSRIFPGEFFHPDNSPNRVYQVINRFRRWIRENALPLAVEEISGSYRLIFTGPFSIAIPRDKLPGAQRELEFLRLRASVQQESFTTWDAVRATGTSRSTVQLILKWAMDSGKLRTDGGSRLARYYWTD